MTKSVLCRVMVRIVMKVCVSGSAVVRMPKTIVQKAIYGQEGFMVQLPW